QVNLLWLFEHLRIAVARGEHQGHSVPRTQLLAMELTVALNDSIQPLGRGVVPEELFGCSIEKLRIVYQLLAQSRIFVESNQCITGQSARRVHTAKHEQKDIPDHLLV